MGRLTILALCVAFAAFPHAESTASSNRRPAVSAIGAARQARIAGVIDSRRETVKTIEAARTSAEDDLRAAIAQHPPDSARIHSLIDELANFSDELGAADAHAQSEIRRLVADAGGRTIDPF
jgi:hypothetical protein